MSTMGRLDRLGGQIERPTLSKRNVGTASISNDSEMSGCSSASMFRNRMEGCFSDRSFTTCMGSQTTEMSQQSVRSDCLAVPAIAMVSNIGHIETRKGTWFISLHTSAQGAQKLRQETRFRSAESSSLNCSGVDTSMRLKWMHKVTRVGRSAASSVTVNVWAPTLRRTWWMVLMTNWDSSPLSSWRGADDRSTR